MNTLILLIVFLPLIAAMFVGLTVRIIPDRLAQMITSGFLVLAALFSGVVFADVAFGSGARLVPIAPWIVSGDFKAEWSLRVDVLTAVMLIVVTWVSAVVHIYSVGYMSHDHHKPRFMAYLSLFTFCMLMLVTADNFVQVFFGWEGVGVCSYLLIGFWFHKESANAAAMKAFLVNRVGDVGLAMGIALIFLSFGTVEFELVFAQAALRQGQVFHFLGMSVSTLDLAGILLFIGCMGKSAQFLLHTWLPDAMEGPTPVSALIHAATMVTAGVFLVARCSPLYEYAPIALGVITVVGAVTAFFAATVGLVQNDIKRIIAYSTCSQLGYMFFACGVSAYSAGIFHLMTHAFFKALLFLGAGSVIHAMSNEQDIRKMGGVAKHIPFTTAYMWLGSLALAGIPPFAGFYSKDTILESAYAAHSTVGNLAYLLGTMGAFMTAFYSWRLLFLTFSGTPRASHEVMHHIHESPRVMLLPLLLLAVGALFSGAIGYYGFGMVSAEGTFWRGSLAMYHDTLAHAHHVPGWVKHLPLLMSFSGIGLAYALYLRRPEIPGKIATHCSGVYRFFLNKWYFDEWYDRLFVRNAKRIGRFLWLKGDVAVIDRFGPNGLAKLSYRGGVAAGKAQSGYLYHYAYAMMLGLLVLLTWYIYVSFGVQR